MKEVLTNELMPINIKKCIKELPTAMIFGASILLIGSAISIVLGIVLDYNEETTSVFLSSEFGYGDYILGGKGLIIVGAFVLAFTVYLIDLPKCLFKSDQKK